MKAIQTTVLAVLFLFSGAAFGQDTKPAEPLAVEPGWIFCMSPKASKYRMCRMFVTDGPPPRISTEGITNPKGEVE